MNLRGNEQPHASHLSLRRPSWLSVLLIARDYAALLRLFADPRCSCFFFFCLIFSWQVKRVTMPPLVMQRFKNLMAALVMLYAAYSFLPETATNTLAAATAALVSTVSGIVPGKVCISSSTMCLHLKAPPATEAPFEV